MAVARSAPKADISLALGSGQIMCSLQSSRLGLTGRRTRRYVCVAGAQGRPPARFSFLGPRRCRMTTGIRCLPRRCAVGVFALLVAAVVVAAGATALAAAET